MAAGLCAQEITPAALSAKPDWRVAVTGNVQANPISLSYGAAFITDGKLITAYSGDSKLLWMQHFSEEPSGISAADRTGALYITIGKRKISKINTDGRVLWTTDTKTDIAFPAVTGLDGRIYVAGGAAITCIGTKGIIRWQIDLSVEDASAKIVFPLINLDDGSVLIFVESSKIAGGIIAKRISPYGGALTESVLMQKIERAVETKSGVVILFSSGDLALFAVGKTQNLREVWRKKLSADFSRSKLFSTSSGKLFSASFANGEKSGTFSTIDSGTGNIVATAAIPPIDFSASSFFAFADGETELIAIDKQTAFSFSPSKNALVWSVSLAAKKDWKYVTYAGDGMLIFTENNWVISGYRVRKSQPKPKPTTFGFTATGGGMPSALKNSAKTDKYIYRNHFVFAGKSTGAVPFDLAFTKNVSSGLEKGFFGDEERQWMQKLLAILSLRNYRVTSSTPDGEKASYKLTSSEMALLVPLMAGWGSAEFLDDIVLLLYTERDTQVLSAAIKAAGIIAYDPDGELLAGLNAVLLRGGDIGPRFYAIIRESALAIIRYMGGNYAPNAGSALR